MSRTRKTRRPCLLAGGRWGAGSEGEKLPVYRVVVTKSTRHGRAKRRTFVVGDDGRWCVDTDDTLAKVVRKTVGTGAPIRLSDIATPSPEVSEARHSGTGYLSSSTSCARAHRRGLGGSWPPCRP